MPKFDEALDLSLCCNARQITALNKKGIMNIQDLHRFAPLRYIDCTKEVLISPDKIGTQITVYAKLERIEERISSAQNIPYLYMTFFSETSGIPVAVSIFRQTYLYNYYAVGVGHYFIIADKLQYDYYRNIYAITPELIEYDSPRARRIVPVFHAVKEISKKCLRRSWRLL